MIQTCTYLYSSSFTPQSWQASESISWIFYEGNWLHIPLCILSPSILFN